MKSLLDDEGQQVCYITSTSVLLCIIRSRVHKNGQLESEHVKLKTRRNLVPLLKTVTHTVHVHRNKPSC